MHLRVSSFEPINELDMYLNAHNLIIIKTCRWLLAILIVSECACVCCAVIRFSRYLMAVSLLSFGGILQWQ